MDLVLAEGRVLLTNVERKALKGDTYKNRPTTLMTNKLLLSAILLLSSICIAQSNPTTFTNNNLPKPEPQSSNYYFNIVTEDGHPVGACPFNSNGCTITFGQPFLYVTLPDIPNQSNANTIACTIKKVVVTGTYGCQTAKCQSATYTATAENDVDNDDAKCEDANGHVWTVTTKQYFHWVRSGLHFIQYYDGGYGSMSY